ncbi:MAG TPA: caspase family protein, partial [Acetobacteraceae bacterium]|nr:caspase family protein [Acetobacteraceae bacterium]
MCGRSIAGGWRAALAALLVLCALHAEARAQRVALVVGVGAYAQVPALANPTNDAADLAAALTRLGFQVELVRDPDRAALEAAVRRYGQRARGAEVALFFYAGHALHFGERNWLLPTSARIASERDLRFEALDLDSVLEQVNGAARLSIILMDACRDNPFRLRLGAAATRQSSGGGLGELRAGIGTLIAFATAPGLVAEDGTGRNSPFTAALLRHIERPGLEIRALMAEVRREVREATGGRQIPWEHSAMEGTFHFRAAPSPPLAPAPPPQQAPGVVLSTREADLLFWDSVRNSSNAAELRAYLARFPNGVFSELARSRLAALERGVPSPPTPAPGPPSTPQAAAPAAPVAARQAALRPLTTAQIREAVPFLSPDAVERVVQRFGGSTPNRALAANPDRRSWWYGFDFAQAETAEQVVLERCQIVHGSPCVLIALNDEIRGRLPAAPRRDMPRVRYSGPFAIEQVPGYSPLNAPILATLRAYAAAREPKALAMHPWGRFFPATDADHQHGAETAALAACNADPERQGRDGPCFLYAIGNRVVLPDRRMAAVTPAPPPPSFEARLIQALARAGDPAAPPLLREQQRAEAALYVRGRGAKAMAVEPESGRMFRWDGVPSPAIAEQNALEGCQQTHGLPCVLV